MKDVESFNFTCIPPCSRDAQFADLGAMPRIYVSSLLKSVPVAVNAVASDAICSKRLAVSAVGLNGKSFLLFLLSTKLPVRLRFFRFSEKPKYKGKRFQSWSRETLNHEMDGGKLKSPVVGLFYLGLSPFESQRVVGCGKNQQF